MVREVARRCAVLVVAQAVVLAPLGSAFAANRQAGAAGVETVSASTEASTPTTGEPRPVASASLPPSDTFPDEARPGPEKKGIGAIVSGSILSLGAIAPIVGGVIIMRGQFVEDTGEAVVDEQLDGAQRTEQNIRKGIGGAVIGLGGVMLAIGVPLVAVGSVRAHRYRQWKRTHRAALAPLHDPGSGASGLSYGFRF